MADRCRTAISLGWYPGVATVPADTAGLHTRCIGDANDGHTEHEGVGLPQFARYQRFHWFTGDRRCYETDRTDEVAWDA
jgi:hypothetical protein